MDSPLAPEPDAKDWTWVLQEPCEECGHDVREVPVDQLGPRLLDTVAAYTTALAQPGATRRPSPQVWSVLEYSCHVRDVHRVFAHRVELMLGEDEPRFPNWDQDTTALEDRYDLQDPAVVGPELVSAAVEVARLYDGVRGAAWQRVGRRSNGSVFTVATLGRYHLHDVLHHLVDIARPGGDDRVDRVGGRR